MQIPGAMRTFGLVSSLLLLSVLGAREAAATRLIKTSVKEARIHGQLSGGVDTRIFRGAVGRVHFKTSARANEDHLVNRIMELGTKGRTVEAHGTTYHQVVNVSSRRRLRGGTVLTMKVGRHDYELPAVATSAVRDLVQKATSLLVDGER